MKHLLSLVMVGVAGAGLAAAWFATPSLEDDRGETAPDAIHVEVVADPADLLPDVPVQVRATDRAGNVLPAPYRCRWTYQHEDLGKRVQTTNECSIVLFVDPKRTRLSRFEHDRKMAIYLVVRQDGRRVAVAESSIRYAGELPGR